MNKMLINAAAAAVVLGIGFTAGTAWACGDGKDGTRCGGEELVAPKPVVIAPTTRPAAKPLTDQVKKGLKWLATTQLENGAWGQGEESANMGGEGKLKATPNVADTCMSVMALIRSGNTPCDGEYRQNTLRAINFICAQIEESDEKSLFITNLRGTRTQSKLGQYIDTFLAAQVLAEVKNQMPDESSGKRVNTALAKVIKKIEANQKENGQWVNDGWAPTLAQAACAKALNTAAVNGAVVSEQVRQRAEQYAQADFASSQKAGAVGAGAGGAGGSEALAQSIAKIGPATTLGGEAGRGDAGVALYSRSAQLATIQASAKANDAKREYFQKIVDAPTTQPQERKKAQEQLDRFSNNEVILADAQRAIVEKLDDKNFVAGFGSNGGEEFLSHLNIGESLLHKGGEDWAKWDKSMSGNLNTIQNADGSWSGHHCITGRTFCTAAALNVLTIDRSPLPAVAKADLKK